MCKPTYKPCSCDQANYLLDALERAWAEMVRNPTKADAILNEALWRDHKCTIDYYKEQA